MKKRPRTLLFSLVMLLSLSVQVGNSGFASSPDWSNQLRVIDGQTNQSMDDATIWMYCGGPHSLDRKNLGQVKNGELQFEWSRLNEFLDQPHHRTAFCLLVLEVIGERYIQGDRFDFDSDQETASRKQYFKNQLWASLRSMGEIQNRKQTSHLRIDPPEARKIRLLNSDGVPVSNVKVRISHYLYESWSGVHVDYNHLAQDQRTPARVTKRTNDRGVITLRTQTVPLYLKVRFFTSLNEYSGNFASRYKPSAAPIQPALIQHPGLKTTSDTEITTKKLFRTQEVYVRINVTNAGNRADLDLRGMTEYRTAYRGTHSGPFGQLDDNGSITGTIKPHLVEKIWLTDLTSDQQMELSQSEMKELLTNHRIKLEWKPE